MPLSPTIVVSPPSPGRSSRRNSTSERSVTNTTHPEHNAISDNVDVAIDTEPIAQGFSRRTISTDHTSIVSHSKQGEMQYPQNQGQDGQGLPTSQQQQQQQQAQQQSHHHQPHRMTPAPGAMNVDYQPQNPTQIPPQYQYPYAGMSGQNFSQPGFQMTIRRPSSSSGPRPDMQSPYQSTSNVGSGSASSSPVNRFSFSTGPSYMPLEPHEHPPPPQPQMPMMPAEPRMGHYNNYQQYPAYDQWHQQQQPQQPMPPQAPAEPNRVPSSRRSTISNPSDHERSSRPSTSDAKTKAKDFVKIEPSPQEDEEDEADEKIDHRKRKRNRTIRSCVPCHNHKRKCDRKRPCGRCTALGLTGTCVYEIDENRDMNDPTVAESERLRRRIAELEQVVRELRQKNPSRSNASAAPPPALPASVDEPDRGQDNKKRRVIVDRFARFKLDEAALAEVAAAASRERSHEPEEAGGATAGGSSTMAEGQATSLSAVAKAQAAIDGGKHDYKSEPYTMYMNPGEEMVHDRVGRKTFLGAPAGASMLRRIRELTSAKAAQTLQGEDDLLSVPEDNAFGIVFPDMRKTFPFTTIWSHENFSGEIIGLLPNKEQAEILLQSWKEEVVTIILGYHVPTLEAEYRRFFEMSTTEKMNVPMSCLAVYLMICSCGCVMRAAKNEIFGSSDGRPSTSSSAGRADNGKDLTSSRLQSELYLSAAYQALRLCSFLSNPTMYTIQAQLLINVYLYASERASDAWSLIGSLVRQSISLGLHVDPLLLDSNVSMREAEVRRRLWWSVAGLDALLCTLFGRPPCITYYTTALPQDRTDDNLSDAPGSAQQQLPPSNVLKNETTDMTFHAAYFQLTIPSFELLSRVFSMKRDFSRSTVFGWFSPSPDQRRSREDHPHTYEDALKLASDIQAWYKNLPRGIQFDPEEDTAEVLLKTRDRLIINQSLMLCMKTHILLVILHRPYLRFDPNAYPESQAVVVNAAATILSAYEMSFQTKASVFWVWWSIPYRTFHAGAVCAFIAVREPGTDTGKKCLTHLRKAIHLFEDRLAGWNKAHPVQSDLVNGLVQLEKLATAATRKYRNSPMPDPSRLVAQGIAGQPIVTEPMNRPRSPAVAGLLSPAPIKNTPTTSGSSGATGSSMGQAHLMLPGTSRSPNSLNHYSGVNTPLSLIRGFPDLQPRSPNPQAAASYVHSSGGGASDSSSKFEGVGSPMPFVNAQDGMASIGLTPFTSGAEATTLPQFWAEMFGIKLDGDQTLAL